MNSFHADDFDQKPVQTLVPVSYGLMLKDKLFMSSSFINLTIFAFLNYRIFLTNQMIVDNFGIPPEKSVLIFMAQLPFFINFHKIAIYDTGKKNVPSSLLDNWINARLRNHSVLLNRLDSRI